MIDNIALKLATGIKHIVPEHPSSIAVLKYSLALLINATAIIIFSICIALFTARLSQTILILFSFAILRQASGGIHLKSGSWCVFASTSLVVFLSFISFNSNWTSILNLASLTLAATFAPSRIEKQSRIPKRFYPLLKLISCLIVSSNFYFLSPSISGAFFIQGLTLIKFRR
jgi:accessory gene regulator B